MARNYFKFKFNFVKWQNSFYFNLLISFSAINSEDAVSKEGKRQPFIISYRYHRLPPIPLQICARAKAAIYAKAFIILSLASSAVSITLNGKRPKALTKVVGNQQQAASAVRIFYENSDKRQPLLYHCIAIHCALPAVDNAE